MGKMKNMDKKNLELLYRSLDDNLETKEQQQLEKVLEKSQDLRKEKEMITAQRKAISDSATRSFKPFFAERVIRRIEETQEKGANVESFYETLQAAFRKFAVLGAAVMIVLILLNFITGDSLSAEEIFYASDLTLESLYDLPLF